MGTIDGIGNLGGLKGADAHCTKLADAAGSQKRTWRAYLSTQVEKGRGISARDRIGSGPWYNARGELIAVDLDQLHIQPNIVKRTALDENGNLVKGRGDKPNEHDILTGTKNDGTAYFPWEKGDHTCNNWTSSGEGSAQVGHHDWHEGSEQHGWCGIAVLLRRRLDKGRKFGLPTHLITSNMAARYGWPSFFPIR